ncbi:Origin recognition complex subunit 2, partial [Gonapodya sp. JEL0774]
DHDESDSSNSDNEPTGDGAADDDFISATPSHERYFHHLSSSKTSRKTTSNNTLTRLPALSHAQYRSLIQKAPVRHVKEIERLEHRHHRQFPQWLFELHQGYSVACYGFGSKRALLNSFARYVSETHTNSRAGTGGEADGGKKPVVVIINGYERGVTGRTIVSDIIDGLISSSNGKGGGRENGTEHATKSNVPRTLPAQLTLLRGLFGITSTAASTPAQNFAIPFTNLYIILHNIDGPSLRSAQSQSALAVLAGLSRVHMVCSVDHVDAGLLWDARKAALMRFAWHDVTTFAPYSVETRDSLSSLSLVARGEGGSGSGRGLQGLKWVLKGVQPNVRKLLRVGVEWMVEKMKEMENQSGHEKGGNQQHHRDDSPEADSPYSDSDGPSAGTSNRRGRPTNKGTTSHSTSAPPPHSLPLNDYWKIGRDHFISNSEQTFRTQLREFFDHGILK